MMASEETLSKDSGRKGRLWKRLRVFPNWPVAALVIALASLAAIGSLAFHRMATLSDANHWESHTYDVIQELELLLSDLKDTETGQRGFIVTGRDLYLEPYNHGVGEVGKRLQKLKQLTADNVSQQGRLVEIERLALLKLTELGETIELRRNRGLDATLAVVNADHGKAVMDMIRKQVAEGKDEELRLLKERKDRKNAQIRHMRSILVVGGLFTGGLLLWAFTGLQREIRRRRQSEAELTEHRNHLEREVQARTAELEAHRELLEEQVADRTTRLTNVNRQLETFTYAASHDLKAPLGRILSFSSLLENNYRNCLKEEGIQFLGQIRQNAARMRALIEDLLAHAKVEQHNLELQTLDLAAAVHLAVLERQVEIREKAAHVHIHLPAAGVWVQADPHGLAQVLRNLLENALKYSAQSKPPTIDVHGEFTGGLYRLSIRDNGIGFKMEYHDKIFQIFQRLHTYDQYAGTGVGLALVKMAMERMGGRVWAESAPGQGATFFLELQAAEVSAGTSMKS